MSTRKSATVNSHPEMEHEAEVEPMPEQLDEVTNSDAVGKIATIAVIGVGAALISAELIPGMLIGLAAAFVPGLGPKIRPMIKSTIRAGYSAVHKTREMVAEASEQMQDVVAEARSEHAANESGKDTAAHA